MVRFGWPLAALAALACVPLAIAPTRAVLTFERPAQLLPALGGTARLVVAYGVLLTGGLARG